MQFFGEEREHGWVGDKWLIVYKGLAAFEAEAESNASMRVTASRRAAWTIAVNAAEQAVHLDRLDRIHLLTYLYEPTSQKVVVSSPKKRKRSYRSKSVKTSSAGGAESPVAVSAASQDDASPPRKRRRRRSSLPLKRDSDRVSDTHVQSSATECDVSLTVTKNTVYFESESSPGKNTNGKSGFEIFLLL